MSSIYYIACSEESLSLFGILSPSILTSFGFGQVFLSAVGKESCSSLILTFDFLTLVLKSLVVVDIIEF